MSLLVNNTLANPQTSFYAAFGSGGGGGSSSNLTSPSAILPGTDSNSFLALVTPVGANTAALSIEANGGTSQLLMNAGAAPASGYEIKTDNFSGNLVIGGEAATTPLATFNATNHTVALGDGAGSSQVNATAATVSLDASLVGTVPNGGILGLTNIGSLIRGGSIALDCSLLGNVPNAGVLTLNNANAQMKAASLLLDASLGGTVNTGGVINLNNTGAGITTGTNPGIIVNAAQTTIRGNYHYVVSLGTVPSAVPVAITSPTQTGLYSITVGGSPADPIALQCGVTCLAYYLGGSGFVSGGNNTALIQSGIDEYAKLFTSNGPSGPIINFQYNTTSAASLTGLSARVVQLTGDLGF